MVPARPEKSPSGRLRRAGGNGAGLEPGDEEARHGAGEGFVLDTERLVAAEEAAAGAVAPIAQLWRDLLKSADAATTPRTLDTLLRDSLATMASVLSVSTVAVLLANESGDELVLRTAIGLEEELTLDIGIRAGEGMAGRVLASRQPLVVDDLAGIDVVNPVLRRSGLRSVVAVPLVVEDRALGVMYAASYEPGRFTHGDAHVLQVVADRLAAALDRVRLFEEERAARREAEALAERLARLQRLTAMLAHADTGDEVARALVDDRAGPEAGARAARAVWLAADEELVLAARSGAPPTSWPERIPIDDDHPVAAAYRDRRASTVRGSGVGVGVGDAASYCVLPIAGQLAPLGVLGVTFQGSELPDGERSTLTTILEQAAQALDRARLATARREAADEAQFFARAAQALAEADTLEETLERLATLAVGVLGDICIIDVLDEDANVVRVAAKHRDPARQALADRLRTEFPPSPSGAHPAIAAIRDARSSWAGSMPDSFLRATTVSEEHFRLVKELDFRSYVTVPIVAAGRALGSVTSVSTSSPFRRSDLDFADKLASQVAAVVDNARRYESAYHTSHILQSSLLPATLPAVEGVVVETRYLTAKRGLEVGGDFYDMLRLPSGQVLVTIGDVAGHDRQAAAQMGHLRSAARALSAHSDSPGALIDTLRASWGVLGFERFATVLAGIVDPLSGAVRFASGGHYPPLLVSAGGAAAYLPVEPAPPLGMPGRPATDWRGTIGEGAVVLGFTDGAVDERGAGIVASMARLAQVATAGDLTPAALCERVVAALPVDRSDDVALIAFSVEPRVSG